MRNNGGRADQEERNGGNVEHTRQNDRQGGAMEALGIFFAAFTLGILGLWIAVVQIEKCETDATPRSGAEPPEVKKAA